jgi:transcriptional regulator with XRE-family HTH domain
MKGEQLKKLRKELGLKQYELAEIIGISAWFKTTPF